MAILTFVTDKDLDLGLKKYFRDQITNDTKDLHIQKTSEAAAFSMIKAKLNNKYDLVKLFPIIKQWSAATPYLIGEYCYHLNKIFKAKTNNTNSPTTNTNDWEESDPRDQMLVICCVNITIYFMTESLNPRKLSDDIKNAFVNAMEWLEDIKSGAENPDWDLLVDGSSSIFSGSNDKLEHYY